MIKIPIEIGDIVRVGRFKNKRIKVKTIEYDDYGLPLINGRPLLTMRIEKLTNKQQTEMIKLELQKIIKEEVQKALKEGPYDITGKYYYIYFNGKDAVQGDPIDTKKELLKVGMEPSDIKNVGPVYLVKVDNYLVYVITSLKSKKDIWCVATPGDAKFAENNEYSYKVCMKAIKGINTGKQITFKDYLKE